MRIDNSSSRNGVTAGPALRQCPTVPGKTESLITHAIRSGPCLQRQREHYHKCHRCVYRGKAADFVHEEVAAAAPDLHVRVGHANGAATNGAARNGAAKNGTHRAAHLNGSDAAREQNGAAEG